VQCVPFLWYSTLQLHESQGILESLLSLQTNAVINTTYFDKELVKNNEMERKLLKLMSWLLKMKELTILHSHAEICPPIESQGLKKIKQSYLHQEQL